MTDWKMLKIEPCDDYNTINEAFTRQVKNINPERNPSDYRRLYVTYKEAVREAARMIAVKEGKRAEDLDFNFNDDRYLGEFMIILDNVCSGELKNSLTIWKSIIDDSDYRTLQRTDSFIAGFDSYMGSVSGLDEAVWKYLIEHFKVYGFAAQNKKLIASLQKYGGIKQDVFFSTESVKAPEQRTSIPEQRTSVPEQRTTIPEQHRQVKQPVRQTASAPVPSAPVNANTSGTDTAGLYKDKVLARYMSEQDDRIVSEKSSDFFRQFERVYTHDITKNNLSAWRYLLNKPEYMHLMRQAAFTQKLTNTLKNIYDLYPAVWEYIIDRTKVPDTHPMYDRTTGELVRLMKANSYKGEITPQGIISPKILQTVIDEDDFVKGHDEYHRPAPMTMMKPKKDKKSEGKAGTIIFIIVFIFIVLRNLFG